MPRPLQHWKVLPHGKLSVIDDNLLTVVGALHMPMGDFPRRMTVARLRDGRLVIFSAIALEEDEMQALEKFGLPTFLVVPSDRHRMDAKIWKDRYPRLLVLAPPGAREKVDEVVRVDATAFDFRDPSVKLVTVPGTDGHEAALVVQSESGTTLVVNELIWNVDHRPGFGGWLMKVTGLTSDGPQIPAIPKMLGFKDQPALRRQLEDWSQLYNLRRIIVSHGDIIEAEPDIVLRDLAQQLAA
ncbi:MAG: hypothetical protein EOO73_19010 [Myxococcales bacterium]|nr:MAG: hypothetical protein EOO73_19010 [Myxococcales bacterium]